MFIKKYYYFYYHYIKLKLLPGENVIDYRNIWRRNILSGSAVLVHVAIISIKTFAGKKKLIELWIQFLFLHEQLKTNKHKNLKERKGKKKKEKSNPSCFQF